MMGWFDLPDFEGYGAQWSPLNEIPAPVPSGPAELYDRDRMPLGATWMLPPDPWFGRMKRWLRGIR